MMFNKKDGWYSVVDDPDSVLNSEDSNIEQIMQALPMASVVPPTEPQTRMEAAQMVLTVPRPDTIQMMKPLFAQQKCVKTPAMELCPLPPQNPQQCGGKGYNGALPRGGPGF